jgi:hypothetical protein
LIHKPSKCTEKNHCRKRWILLDRNGWRQNRIQIRIPTRWNNSKNRNQQWRCDKPSVSINTNKIIKLLILW